MEALWDNVHDENKPDTLTGNNRVCPTMFPKLSPQ